MMKVLLILIASFSMSAVAQERLPGVFTYQGRAYQADGTTPLGGNATFLIQIRSSNGNCLLYQETHGGIDLTASAGLFAINIGDGSAKSGLSLTSVFSNSNQPKTTLSGTCGGTYTPANQEARVLRITVNTGTPVQLDDQYIYSVPKALVADSLNGYTYNQFVQHLTTTQRDALTSMVNGTTIYNITTGRFNRYNGATWTEAFGVNSVGTGSSIYKGKMAGNDWLELRSILGGNGITVTQNTNDVTLAIDPTYTQRRITGTCTAGNFITAIAQDGTVTCAADATGGGLTVVATDNTTIDGDGDATPLFVIDGGITAAKLAVGAIDATTKLAAGLCAANQILKKRSDNTAWECAADTDTGLTNVYADTTTIEGDGSLVSPFSIVDGGVNTLQLADDAVTAAKLADASVDAVAKLANTLCAANQVLKKRSDNSAWECAADATGTALPAMTDAQIIVSNGTTPAAVAMSGDATISNAGALTIANNAVETVMIGDDQVTAAKLADASIDAVAKLAAGLCAANQILKKRADNTAWECTADSTNTGDITDVVAGSGLTGGAASGSATVNVGAGTGITVAADSIAVDTSVIQARVTGTCVAGSSIRIIASDGTVTCETDDGVSGTTNYVPKYTSASAIGNSSMTDNGTTVNFTNSQISLGGSLFLHKPGTSNTFLGVNSGNTSLTGSGNVSLGSNSLAAITTGQQNVSIGSYVLDANTTGSYNGALGVGALGSNIDGDNNTAIGNAALLFKTTGDANTALGRSALASNETGARNTGIGFQAGTNSDGASSGNVYIGYNAGPSSNTVESDKLYIDNTQGTPLISGDFANNRVGIQRVPTTYNFEVQGTAGKTDGSTAWNTISDRRLKDVGEKYRYGLAEILKLNTLRFHYKKDNHVGMDSEKEMIGVIAQDVMTVIPEAVNLRQDGYYDINVDPIHWAVINAIQDLAGMSKMSEKQARELEARVANVERTIASLEQQNKAKDLVIQSLERENVSIKARLEKIEKLLNLK